MRRRLRQAGLLGVAVVLLVVGIRLAPMAVVRFNGPHRFSAPAAILDAAVVQSLGHVPRSSSAEELIAVALDETSRRLHFGLSHRTTLQFGSAEREGNCIEYAHLFASLVRRFGRDAGLDVTATVVRSFDPRLAGQTIPGRSFADHDWVLVEAGHGAPPAGQQRWFVDPSLHDLGLGWDIEHLVRGPVGTPRTP